MVYEIEYNLKSVPTIKNFLESRKRLKFIMGPMGSGKSSGCVIHLFNSMISQKPFNNVRRTRYAIVRNTARMLQDTTKKTIDDWLPKLLYTWKEAKAMYIFRFELEDGTIVESEWLLRALDEPEQVRDLLSLEISGAWINEAREIDFEFFKVLRGRIGRYPSKKQGGVAYPYIIMDSNPPSTEHWLHDFFVKNAEANEKLIDFFKQPSGLSPEAENIENLPPDYYQDLAIGQDEDYIRVYIHGEFGYTKEGKPVFTAYSDSIHCTDKELKPIKELPLIIGMDFGLYPACVITQTTPDGRLFVYDELVTIEPIDVETFIKDVLKPHLNSKYLMYDIHIVGDPAGSARSQVDFRSCYTLLKYYGFTKAYPAYTNSLHDRIKAVNYYLTRYIKGSPAFILSSKCQTLREGFNGKYHFRRIRVATERYAELPDKNNYSHVMDALQYACLGYSPAMSYNKEVEKLSIRQDQKPSNYAGFV